MAGASTARSPQTRASVARAAAAASRLLPLEPHPWDNGCTGVALSHCSGEGLDSGLGAALAVLNPPEPHFGLFGDLNLGFV